MAYSFQSDLVGRLKERYPQIHPLIFHRSMERAKSPGDLFDILETFPDKYPVIWNDQQHRWIKDEDMLRVASFNEKRKKQQ
jgi:hypothetical protein